MEEIGKNHYLSHKQNMLRDFNKAIGKIEHIFVAHFGKGFQ